MLGFKEFPNCRKMIARVAFIALLMPLLTLLWLFPVVVFIAFLPQVAWPTAGQVFFIIWTAMMSLVMVEVTIWTFYMLVVWYESLFTGESKIRQPMDILEDALELIISPCLPYRPNNQPPFA